MNFNVKQAFFKKISRKIRRFSMHVKHKSLIFVVGKCYPVNTLKALEQGVKSVQSHEDARTFLLLLTLNMCWSAE